MSLLGRRMKIYTVHVRPDLPDAQEQAEFVPEGFNWMAFFLTGIWALYHRLWRYAFLIFAVNAAFIAARESGWISMDGLAALQLGFQAFVGFSANDWRRRRLDRKGYVMADIAASDSQLAAEQRYYERYLAAHPTY